MQIIQIESLQILDSRGNPTIEVKIVLKDGSNGTFKVPSGASTGIHEAVELRDNNKNIYHGKSIQKAIKNISSIKKELLNIDFTQKSLDEKLISLDGTDNKSLIGANAILGISIAFAKASAKYYNLPLYEYLYRLINDINFKNKSYIKKKDIHLFANIINGGLHSENELNIQEFMLVPLLENTELKIRSISEIYHSLKKIIKKDYGNGNTNIGDEGGFAPQINKTKQALDLLTKAIKNSNYENYIAIAIDAAASDFYNKENQKYEIEKDKFIDYKELTKYYNELIKNYPIISIEDPFAEDDFEGFQYFMKNMSKTKIINPLNNKNNKKIIIVGDDLLVTNPKRINIAINKNLCSSLLLKINQIGTLTESIQAYKMAINKNWHVIVSHRSGETEDSFISDLAVAMKSSIKLGAPARGERTSKYNRLLHINK